MENELSIYWGDMKITPVSHLEDTEKLLLLIEDTDAADVFPMALSKMEAPLCIKHQSGECPWFLVVGYSETLGQVSEIEAVPAQMPMRMN